MIQKTGKAHPYQVKSADELPQAGDSAARKGFLSSLWDLEPINAAKGLGGDIGLNQVSEAQASLAREQYRQFLRDLDKHKKMVLGSKAGTPAWTIEKQDEEE